MGVFPKDVPLVWSSSLLLGVAIWSLRLISLPQLYADSLKCTSYSVDSVLAAARYTVSYVHASTSKAARRRMTAWRNEHEGCFWAVKLDVRDLGGHLDVTLRAVAGTLSSRVRIATTQVPAVGAPGVSTHAWDGAIEISAWRSLWL